MATSAPALPLPKQRDLEYANKHGILGLIPGIALLAAVGYAGKFIEQSIARYGKAHHQILPNIEYVLWAILIGVLIANTVGLPRIFRAGVATYEFWLKAGIILLGARFILGDILHLSGISFVLIFIELLLALTFMTYLGRAFELSPKLISLLAVGSSVCGVSAIIATQGAIEAEEEDSSVAIAAILALGAISLVFFPLVGHALHMSDHAYGLWTGLAVDNTAEATAAGALYSDAAGKFAVLAKTCRNACIGFVVLGYAIYWAKKGQAAVIGNKGAFLWKKFPKFVLGFLFISLGGDDWDARCKGFSASCGVDSIWVYPASDCGAGESIAVGVFADVCRGWAADELPGPAEAGGQAVCSGGDRGDCDRRDYVSAGFGGGPLLSPVSA